MKYKKKIVLEWTEINGKKIPKRIRYIVDELPKINKGNGELIDEILNNERDLQLERN